ncbi:MAG: autotransporter outer membrane beta-barrel domain-containing protein, partial [Variovorax sp.]|nr:autotransporter outer membrane beta-barrel domain-containing protein [Variovorax sp.]
MARGAYVAAPETARAGNKAAAACVAALAMSLLAGAAHAQSTINTVDTGWYRNDGYHLIGNDNYITGNYSGDTYRSYYVFDLGPGALAPDQIFSSATLNVNTAGVLGLPASGAAFQTVLYNGNASALGSTSNSTATYAALGDGTPTGSTEVSSSTPSGSILSVQLNAAGLSGLTAAAGQLVALGGSLTGISGTNVYLAGTSGGPQSLTYTVTTLAAGQYYWDLDGGTAGAGGASPSGVWGRTNAQRFWNADSAGVGPTVAWINGSTANFAAGNDATGSFTVTLGDNVTVNGIGYQGGAGSQLRVDAGTGFEIVTSAGSNSVDVVNAGTTMEVAAGVSGPGAVVKDGQGTLTLSGTSTYTGGTTVQAGTLAAGSAGGFVQNSAYTVNGGTLDLGSWDLATSSFSGTGGTVALNARTLTANQATDSSYAGAITGTGSLVKTGAGTLTLSGASSYSGGTALKEGQIKVGSSTALGSGELAMDDGTTLGFSVDGLTLANAIRLTGSNDPVIDTGSFHETLAGAISGGGFLTKQGSGTLTLSGANTYTGATNVAQGTLRAGAANAFCAASAHQVAAGATLETGGFNQAVAGLTNAGTVSLLGATAGSTLTVNGNYVGSNGLLRVGTVLGDSSSATDKLVVTGSASGTTAVQVTNLGGLGGQTTGNGIQVVSAAGGIAGGAFSLAAPVSAGAYDYRLDVTGTGAYLSNTLPTQAAPTYRADVPLYAALPEQLRQSNLAMLGNMHQRIGDDGGTGSNTSSPDQGYRQAWGRVISIDRDIAQSGTVSPHSEGRLTGFQAGTDLWANANWRTGVYVGQLEGDMSVTGFARGVVNYAAGSNDLRSQYLGAYATWKNDSGLYVDGVL